ncbi:MAG: 2'-5' RNA ligase family protein, partial [Bryobacteraceae bacterium]
MNSMVFEPKGKGRLNCFALVTYIRDPLAKFLDELRKELIPGCTPHAHVTILPPRPIASEGDDAAEAARTALADVPAFELEAGEIEVFRETNVVYLSISKGLKELHALHALANTGPVVFKEPFPYHPHITLAQDLTAEQCAHLEQVA